MAGTDTSAYDEVLKTVYGDGIKELIPTKVRTLEMFMERDAKPWGGRFVEYPARVGRNQGSGWASEMGNIPTAGKQKYTDVRIPMRYQYGRIQLSAQVMKSSEGSKNAFASAMQQEMDGIIKDMTSDRGRAIFGDGRGILAIVNGDPGTTVATVTVDSPGGFAGATNGARFINPGMIIGFVDPATGALRASNRTVVNVPAAGTTFTTDSAMAAAVADNDYIVRVTTAASTDVGDSSYQKEFMGLAGMIDDGTYVATLHNVNRVQYPIYQSSVISSVGAWSADVMQRGIDLADERGDGDISDLIMHHSVRRAYLASMEQDRRYVSGDLSRPDSGTVAAKKGRLAFGAIPITEDKYAPYGTVFGADRSGFSRYTLVGGEWMDEDGAVLCRVGTGGSAVDAFEATYRIWDNFHCDFPNRCFRLDGITANVTVAHID